MSLGQKIKILRIKHGMTQSTLALHIAVKHSAVSEYENDKHKPSLGQLKTIARLFGTTVDDLLRRGRAVRALGSSGHAAGLR